MNLVDFIRSHIASAMEHLAWVEHAIQAEASSRAPHRIGISAPCDFEIPDEPSHRAFVAIHALRSLLPKPDHYVLVCGGVGLMHNETFPDLDAARFAAAELTKDSDWSSVSIHAATQGLRWLVEIWKHKGEAQRS